MDSMTFYATIDEDVYVEEMVISSELGDGSDAIYSPKKVKLFFWEGGFPPGYCRDECREEKLSVCSDDYSKVVNRECGEFDSDVCKEYGGDTLVDSCEGSERCFDGECRDGPWELVCKKKVIKKSGCYSAPYDECDDNDGGQKTGDCNCDPFGIICLKEKWECWNYVEETVDCDPDPSCSVGYSEVSRDVCEMPCVETSWTPSTDDYCFGVSFSQTSDCGTTRSAVGTGACVASLSASYVLGSSEVLGGYTYYNFTSTISESNGVGVTINSRQKCYVASDGNNWCDSVSTSIAPDYGTNYIVPGGQISDPSNYVFFLPGYTYTTTETFNGVDDEGNSVQASYSFSVTP